jgi:hypothetical protein
MDLIYLPADKVEKVPFTRHDAALLIEELEAGSETRAVTERPNDRVLHARLVLNPNREDLIGRIAA